MTFSRNHYELLEVPRTVDSTTLRRAFCKLSKALHPDTTSLPQSEAANQFQQLCEAYETLSDPSLRRLYDANLARENIHNATERSQSELTFKSFIQSNKTVLGVRRPLSGGELFSLLLLAIALLVSLLLGIGFAIAHGREWSVRPSWLMVIHMINKYILPNS